MLASDISFSVFYNECCINAWWIRDKPALRCQHYMELLWDAAVREFFRIIAKLHVDTMPVAVRKSNYWSFFGERMMGYIIRFIHNRDLAAENIMTAYWKGTEVCT